MRLKAGGPLTLTVLLPPQVFPETRPSEPEQSRQVSNLFGLDHQVVTGLESPIARKCSQALT
jgi:hypothetical protein